MRWNDAGMNPAGRHPQYVNANVQESNVLAFYAVSCVAHKRVIHVNKYMVWLVLAFIDLDVVNSFLSKDTHESTDADAHHDSEIDLKEILVHDQALQ